MKSIGIGIGKKRCFVCIKDGKRNVLERTDCSSTFNDALELAKRLKKKYGRCQAACESTGNMWIKTFGAFEKAGMSTSLQTHSG